MHTSESNPLRIAELPLGKGLMGLTICPGKKDKEAMSGPSWRSLDADMRVIKEWGAGIIVTLMEEWELQYLRVMPSAEDGDDADLGAAARSRNIKWWHLPVKDGTGMRREWKFGNDTRVSAMPLDLECALLRHFLHSGGRVLIHCRGGLGRTGTLAARLLMEEGMDAESAMCTVRAVRPGAIETEEQEEYLRKFAKQRNRMAAQTRKKRKSKNVMPPLNQAAFKGEFFL